MSEAAYQRMILGYHGCSRELGRKVLLDGHGLLTSENEWDWLGRGIYFWEFGLDRAREWAKSKHGDDAFVLGAYLNLGRCFDLTDTLHTSALRELFKKLQRVHSEQDLPMPENQPGHAHDGDLIKRHLDCAVLNFAMQAYDERARKHDLAISSNGVYYQSVRGIFQEGGPAFAGSMIRSKTHVQVEVRDPDLIVGYFNPAEAHDG